MIPLRDDNPTFNKPVVIYMIIGVNIAAFALLQGLSFEPMLSKSICRFGLIPAELLGRVNDGTLVQLGPQFWCETGGFWTNLTPLTSMFMHGGWFHIIGNMWFLHIFGDNIEDAMGTVRFTIFYLLCGLAAAAAQIMTDPNSLIPMVGASGAIGGVMGAYALLYPKARVLTLVPLGFILTTISIPAVFLLGLWFIIQLVSGLPTLSSQQAGVAFWAHIGGFTAGLLLVKPFLAKNRRRPKVVRVRK